MKANQHPGKTPQPETAEQTRTWTTVQGRYLRAGLCQRCASQAAYGHQQGSGGWSAIRPPCAGCVGMNLPNWLIEMHGDRGQRWLLAEYVKGQIKPSKWAPGGEYWKLENTDGQTTGGTPAPTEPQARGGAPRQHESGASQLKPVVRAPGTIWHPKCGKSWTGTQLEHCPVCCQTFSGPSAGDKHRKGPHGARHCALPETVGLVYDQDRDMWRMPGTWSPPKG